MIGITTLTPLLTPASVIPDRARGEQPLKEGSERRRRGEEEEEEEGEEEGEGEEEEEEEGEEKEREEVVMEYGVSVKQSRYKHFSHLITLDITFSWTSPRWCPNITPPQPVAVRTSV